MKIVLDAAEDKIRKILLQYATEFAQTGNPSVTLRFTGGWVRDKLLGRSSHDIDVAIDKTTGEEFATGSHKFMESRNMAETKGVHKVASNPEKSKHLETAMTRICGLDLDFVNLRSEEYASDSRVPSTIKFGTPEEDASRRDATSNALFYNLTTDTVEDFTGRGLDDLKNGILRTPLDPAVTFSDDPSRVLRSSRFVGQLGFTVAPDTFAAMHGDQIGAKIQAKVSEERIGKEIEKLLGSDYSQLGMKNLVDSKLAPYIFTFRNLEKNPKVKPVTVDEKLFEARFNSMIWSIESRFNFNNFTTDEKIISWLASLLQDLPEEGVSNVVHGGLKSTRIVKEGCSKLVKSGPAFDQSRTMLEENTLSRKDLGSFVRLCGPLWKLAIPFNAARLYFSKQTTEDSEKIYQLIIDNHLESAFSLKPAIAGKALMNLLDMKPGPQIAKVLDGEIKYQLDHPDSSTGDIEQWLVNEYKSQ